MWIKIIRQKTWDNLQEELEGLRTEISGLMGQHKNLHELYKGQYQKGLAEKNDLGDALKQRDKEIEELKKMLRKAEHQKNEAVKKLQKLSKKVNS